MRLEFEPNITAFPLVENEVFEDVGLSSDLETVLKNGITAAQNGERETARAMLTQVSAIDPLCEDAWMWLASISDYPEELLAFLDRVLDINPANARAAEWRSATTSLLAKTFVQRGIAARQQGDDRLAAQCIAQALAHDYECEIAWFWKASIAEADDEKTACLNEVIRLNPENEDARNALEAMKASKSKAAFDEAKAAAVAGKRKKAVDILDEFLQRAPSNVEAWILRSHLSSSVEEKIESLEKALAIDSENTAARSAHDFLTSTFGPADTQGEPVAPQVEMSSEDPFPETETAEIFASESPKTKPGATDSVPVSLADEQPFNGCETRIVYFEELAPLVDSDDEISFDGCKTLETVCEPEADVYGRSAEELFGTLVETVNAQSETVESLPSVAYELAIASLIQTDEAELSLAETQNTGVSCPFCTALNDVQAFECSSCHAVLTLSDTESLLANKRAAREVIQQAVTQMEAEWNSREFNEQELTALGIGHINLQNYDSGLKYLQEALRFNPNNVILSGHLNTIAIRLNEMRRQDEIHDSMPKGKSILVVDDSPTVRKLISGKLEKSGHNVICAVDGIEALERLGECMPDLVLLDITMPRMDGYEVCKQIRSNPAAKDLPVVMISGKDGFFDKVRGRMAGTTGYVTKPFGPETLMKALETYLLPETEPVN